MDLPIWFSGVPLSWKVGEIASVHGWTNCVIPFVIWGKPHKAMSPLQRQTKYWLHGLVAAAVSGLGVGLGAFAAGLTLRQFLIVALAPVVIGVGGYLKQSPLPPEEDAASAQAAGK